MTQRTPPTRPFLPQTHSEWLAIPKVLTVLALVGLGVWWLQSFVDPQWFTWFVLIMLLAEPMLHDKFMGRTGSSSHAMHHGRMAIVTQSCEPIGRVNLDGTPWAAKSLDDRPLQPGECVYVHDGDGLLLHVSRQEPTA